MRFFVCLFIILETVMLDLFTLPIDETLVVLRQMFDVVIPRLDVSLFDALV